MIGQAPQKTASANELTPRDDNKKVVSEILKRVDSLIKKNDLAKALAEIAHAKEIDPRNVYTLALEERIMSIKADNAMQEPVQPEAAASPVVSPAPQTIRQEQPAPAVKETASLEDLGTYEAALKEAWKTGMLKPDMEKQLRELRQALHITEMDHNRLEKEVKRECQKTVTPKTLPKAAIIEVKAPISIPPPVQTPVQQQSPGDSQFISSAQHRKQKDKVLVIDDDARLLELLAASLEDSGFDVIALTTSDEAYALLRKFIPDLILCDINLETSTMGGFTFYEKVQELKNVSHVPFIFLTGLTDEALVRTGKELGVDDYLMKPISEETLLSTLRGKLKRFRQLRKIIAPSVSPIPAMV